jgi:hypothetical protein
VRSFEPACALWASSSFPAVAVCLCVQVRKPHLTSRLLRGEALADCLPSVRRVPTSLCPPVRSPVMRVSTLLCAVSALLLMRLAVEASVIFTPTHCACQRIFVVAGNKTEQAQCSACDVVQRLALPH